jgi:hypothetical protein
MAEKNNQNTTPKSAGAGQKDEQPVQTVRQAPEQVDPAKEKTAEETAEQLKATADGDDANAQKAQAILRETENQQATEDGEYRYLSGVGSHVHDGQRLKPGDVVKLSARQAAAFKDKFEKA